MKMGNTTKEDFYAAVGLAAVIYSAFRGQPFIAQNGPILGVVDHLCVGLAARLFCQVADTIVGHTCAPFGPRSAALLGAVSGVAVGFLAGYPAGNYLANQMNPYVNEYVVRPIKQEFNRDNHKKRVSYDVPQYKASELG